MKVVGVLDVQGDVTEHLDALREAADVLGLEADVVAVKTPEEVLGLSALVLPGGESTTLGKLLAAYGMDDSIKKIALRNVPVMGTCAGLILLAKEGDDQVGKTGQPLLGLMDIKVNRNAFGSQKESFEAEVSIPVIGDKPFPGVFIRAPLVERVFGGVEVLCRYKGEIVMVRQGNLLGLAFHPELSGDSRIHEYFLKFIKC